MAVDYSDLRRRTDDLAANIERFQQQVADDKASDARAQRVEAAMNALAVGVAKLNEVNRDGWPRHSAQERADGTAQLQVEFRAAIAEEEETLSSEIAQATAHQANLEAESRDVMKQLDGAALTRALQLRTIRAGHVRIWSASDLWPQIRAAVAGDDPSDRAAWFDVLNERIAELGDHAPADLTLMATELRQACVSPEVARKLKTAQQRVERKHKARRALWDQVREVKVAMLQDEMRANPAYARL